MPPRAFPTLALAVSLVGVSRAPAGDRPLIPPAPQPGPTTPNFMNPVPGQTGAPPVPVAPPVVPPPQPCPPVVDCPPGSIVIWSPNEFVWGLGTWHARSPRGYRIGLPHEPLDVTSRRLDPQALPSAPRAPLPPAPQELAILLLRAEQWDQAAAALSVLLTHARERARGTLTVPPGSSAPTAPIATQPPPAATTGEPPWSVGETQRLLALALLGQRRAPQAVRALAEAYAAEPALCDQPLGPALLGSAESLRRLMLRAVTHAQSAGTEDAWFAAAVMMQAQGRKALPPNVAARLHAHPLGKRLFAGPVPGTP